jgi:hypothetical protein
MISKDRNRPVRKLAEIRDNTVCIATEYGWDKFWQGQESSLFHPDWLCGQPSFLSRYLWFFSLWVKLLGHEADHSPATSAKVKKM